MKLGKLLGMGNSFFGGNQAIAYRLNKFVLPKFNDGRNPFTPKPAAEPPAATKAANTISAPAKLIAPLAVPVVAQTQKPVPPVAKPARPTWTAKLNPFRAAEPVAPQPLAVQPELSLDAVKVMHNDLTDADVDIVPAKSHDAPVAAPMLSPSRQAWEYLGESVLKS